MSNSKLEHQLKSLLNMFTSISNFIVIGRMLRKLCCLWGHFGRISNAIVWVLASPCYSLNTGIHFDKNNGQCFWNKETSSLNLRWLVRCLVTQKLTGLGNSSDNYNKMHRIIYFVRDFYSFLIIVNALWHANVNFNTFIEKEVFHLSKGKKK